MSAFRRISESANLRSALEFQTRTDATQRFQVSALRFRRIYEGGGGRFRKV